jgi:Ca2+-binding RTX toxin-like protein
LGPRRGVLAGANIEDVQGIRIRHTIIGDDGPNALRGDLGGDTISGGGGDEILIGDCAGVLPHFLYEEIFDCSSPDLPDDLDGGAGDDLCLEGEALNSGESNDGEFRVQVQGDLSSGFKERSLGALEGVSHSSNNVPAAPLAASRLV